jgi:hypothetical protein
MITTTASFHVTGKSHEDLLVQAKNRLSDFFDIPLADVSSQVSFDLVVSERKDVNEFDEEEDEYTAEVIAKVKEHV